MSILTSRAREEQFLRYFPHASCPDYPRHNCGCLVPGLPLVSDHISTRVHNALKRNGYHTRQSVTSAPDQELLRIRNFGPKALAEVRAVFQHQPKVVYDPTGLIDLRTMPAGEWQDTQPELPERVREELNIVRVFLEITLSKVEWLLDQSEVANQ